MSIARCVSSAMKVLEKASLYSNNLSMCMFIASLHLSTKSLSSLASKMTCNLLPVLQVFFKEVEVSAGVDEARLLVSVKLPVPWVGGWPNNPGAKTCFFLKTTAAGRSRFEDLPSAFCSTEGRLAGALAENKRQIWQSEHLICSMANNWLGLCS